MEKFKVKVTEILGAGYIDRYKTEVEGDDLASLLSHAIIASVSPSKLHILSDLIQNLKSKVCDDIRNSGGEPFPGCSKMLDRLFLAADDLNMALEGLAFDEGVEG